MTCTPEGLLGEDVLLATIQCQSKMMQCVGRYRGNSLWFLFCTVLSRLLEVQRTGRQVAGSQVQNWPAGGLDELEEKHLGE